MPELIEALSQRRARRAFDSRPVPSDVQEVLWRAVSVAPSHGNSQPARILVAESEEVRGRLIASLSEGNRQWAPRAPLLFAIAVNPAHDLPGKNADGSERQLWAFQTGIALGNLLAQATAMGLIAHPMGGFDQTGVLATFHAPYDLRVMAVVACGYPGALEALPEDLQAKEVSQQQRIPLENLVAHDRWRKANAMSAHELRHAGR